MKFRELFKSNEKELKKKIKKNLPFLLDDKVLFDVLMKRTQGWSYNKEKLKNISKEEMELFSTYYKEFKSFSKDGDVVKKYKDSPFKIFINSIK